MQAGFVLTPITMETFTGSDLAHAIQSQEEEGTGAEVRPMAICNTTTALKLTLPNQPFDF